MDELFGVVILYNPTDEVARNITSYSTILSKLFVFDNSESSTNWNRSNLSNNCVLISDGVNRGISERLNAAAKMAIAAGAKWLLTMDQDSSFEKGELEQYLSCFHSFEEKDTVAMFGIEHETKMATDACQYEKTDNLITSGSLVNLDVFQKIGGFDENLFIDEVDSEYCYKAIVKGYRTIKFKNVLLTHSLGQVQQHRSLKTLKLTRRTLHSPLRIYYMVRNYLYVRDKYQQQLPASFPHRKAAIKNRIKNNFLYGNERIRLMRYLLLAYRHYKSGRLGKLINLK